ncbi:uncharacterized protein LOC115926367 [Strongylocentrotus purpuratus]|uniref:HECT-type E3 ubiquitin transferase n=1 Tax=Strongylocentrotus purpuratus TaxID=7668 RepID=A0A7M7P6U8_STRPU|nr:uncharacterized protein LOC115926367 [Strongylocentrotus purpuratus]
MLVIITAALNLKIGHLQFEIDDDKEKVVESAISKVKGKDETSLLLPFEVYFKDNVSLGVNAGGPMKEFFSRLFEELFNVEKHSIFKKLDDSPSCTTLWFNKDSKDLDKLRAVGKLFALMFYNKVIVTMPFPFLFYKKLLGNIGIEERQGSYVSLIFGGQGVQSPSFFCKFCSQFVPFSFVFRTRELIDTFSFCLKHFKIIVSPRELTRDRAFPTCFSDYLTSCIPSLLDR